MPFVHCEDQVADILTKAISSTHLESINSKLGTFDIHTPPQARLRKEKVQVVQVAPILPKCTYVLYIVFHTPYEARVLYH
jgi:hypothetical protein